MRLGSIVTFTSVIVTVFALVAPQDTKIKREDVDQLDIASIGKRDNDQFLNTLVSLLNSSNLLNSLVNKVSESPDSNAALFKTVTSFISLKSINASSLFSALEHSGFVSQLFNSTLGDEKLFQTALDYAKKLYQSGDLKISSIVENLNIEKPQKRELSPLSKRDSDYITKLVEAIGGPETASNLAAKILNNKDLAGAAKNLIASSVNNMDFSKLFDSIKQSDIVSELLDHALKDPKSIGMFADMISSQIKDGKVKRSDITGARDVAALGQNMLVSPIPSVALETPSLMPTSVTRDILGGLFDAPSATPSNTADPILPVLAVPSSTKAATKTDSFLDQLLGQKSNTTSTKATPTSKPTSGGGLDSIFDGLFGKPKNSTKTTQTSKPASTDNILENILGDLFKPSNKTSQPSSKPAGDNILGNILGDLFKPSNKTSHPSSKPAGDTFEDLFKDLFGSPKNSTSKPGTSSNFLEDLLNDLFHHNGTSKGGSGSKGNFLSDIFGIVTSVLHSLLDDFGKSTNTNTSHISLSSLLLDLFDAFFGGSSNPSGSSSGGGLGRFFENLLNKLFGGLSSPSSHNGISIGGLIGGLLDKLLDELFGSSGGSSSGYTPINGPIGPSGKKCCCTTTGAQKKEFKRQAKRAIKQALVKRAQELGDDLYIKHL